MDRAVFEANAGLYVDIDENITAGLTYNGDFSGGPQEHQGNLSIKIRF